MYATNLGVPPPKNSGKRHCKLGCVPNFVNFGSQTAKNRIVVLTHPKSTFSDAHIRGANGRCPLKN